MTPREAAAWMLSELRSEGHLYQETAATHLRDYDDDELAYYDHNGNLCVGKKVLAEFLKITPEYVFERRDKFWRERLDTDEPGRRQ